MYKPIKLWCNYMGNTAVLPKFKKKFLLKTAGWGHEDIKYVKNNMYIYIKNNNK